MKSPARPISPTASRHRPAVFRAVSVKPRNPSKLPTIASAVLASLTVRPQIPTDFGDPSWVQVIRDCAVDTGMLVGLLASQQIDCVDLLIKLTEMQWTAMDTQLLARDRRSMATRGQAMVHLYDRRLGASSAQIEQLLSQLAKDRIKLAPEVVAGLEAAIQLLAPSDLRSKGSAAIADIRRAIDSTPKAKRNYKTISSGSVVGFLVNECGLKHDEAEVRVAKFTKRYWGRPAKYRELGDSLMDTKKGSDAIRQSYTRYRRLAAATPSKPDR